MERIAGTPGFESIMWLADRRLLIQPSRQKAWTCCLPLAFGSTEEEPFSLGSYLAPMNSEIGRSIISISPGFEEPSLALSSLITSRQRVIASRMFARASSRVEPSETQPGMSKHLAM